MNDIIITHVNRKKKINFGFIKINIPTIRYIRTYIYKKHALKFINENFKGYFIIYHDITGIKVRGNMKYYYIEIRNNDIIISFNLETKDSIQNITNLIKYLNSKFKNNIIVKFNNHLELSVVKDKTDQIREQLIGSDVMEYVPNKIGYSIGRL